MILNLRDCNMWRRKSKYIVYACAIMFVCMIYNFFGIGDYMFTKSFESEFDYPLNIDIKPVVERILKGEKPGVDPINFYPYKFLSNSGTCKTLERLDLFIVVKSAMDHFGHRAAIRQTYGQENVIPGRIVKTLFFLGIDESHKSELQKKIDKEMAEHKDIIQLSFRDNYYNNTIKTMMSFRWVFDHCPRADFYLFTDDDMYISVGNLLDYVHEQADSNRSERDRKAANRIEKEEKILFAGYVFRSSPHRYKTSKWRVSLEEYPWDRWPPYCTAGAYIVSNLAMKVIYVGSFFVKHFRFDDIYLGIVAKKVGIEPVHCPGIHFYEKEYSKEGYRDVIASHGYADHDQLIRVWNEQNTLSRL